MNDQNLCTPASKQISHSRMRWTGCVVATAAYLSIASGIALGGIEPEPNAAKPAAPAAAAPKPAATTTWRPATPILTDFDRLCAALDFSGYPDHITDAAAKGTVRLAGSTTVANLMHRTGDALEGLTAGRVKVSIEGGGSAIAVPALIEGRCDVGTLSRSVSDKERAAFAAKFGYPLTELPIAIDAVAISVNKRNPIAGLTMKQLELIFAQTPRDGGLQAKSWGDIGAKDLPPDISSLPLLVYGQYEGSGARSIVSEVVLGGKPFGQNVRSEPVPSSVTQGVASDRGGIGYASIFYDNVRTRPVPLSIDGKNFIEPSYENVVDGSYPLARAFYAVLNVPPGQTPSAPVREVLGFLLSREGQQLMAAEGNFPLTKKQVADGRATVLGTAGDAGKK